MAYQFDTLTLHAGQLPDSQYGARAQPIYLTSSFVFRDGEQAAALFNGERGGHFDGHLSNPTTAVLEERIAALEGGVGAVAASSGQAALHLAIVTLAGAGGHLVASRSLGGAARHLLEHTLPRFGIATTFVDPRDHDAWRAAILPQTRLLLGETLGNHGLDVLDIARVAKIAHEQGLPLLVDSTLTTPYLLRPFDLGADLVVHSASAFLGGHGVVIGGLLVDSGRFDWVASGKFPALSEPCAGFGGINFGAESTVAAFLIRARLEGLNDFGACLSPLSAFHILQGMETLSLRMARHIDSTRRLLAHLLSRCGAGEPVAAVTHPDLPGHPDHQLARKLLPRGSGSVFAFTLRGGRAAAFRFIEALRVFSHLSSVGDAKSLVIHPASTTHCRLSGGAMAAAGVDPGTIRLSVGLEDPNDLIDDINRGLAAVSRG
jgi:O-acetylhomoserine (thiol)-lyase